MEGDRSLALEGTGDLLGEAERGWDQTGTVTPHTGMPARQDQRLLCPRGKGLLDRGCLQRRVGASAVHSGASEVPVIQTGGCPMPGVPGGDDGGSRAVTP